MMAGDTELAVAIVRACDPRRWALERAASAQRDCGHPHMSHRKRVREPVSKTFLVVKRGLVVLWSAQVLPMHAP